VQLDECSITRMTRQFPAPQPAFSD
jgi:hypothetical protein